MSTNCINCIRNERTGIDLLCDDCRVLLTFKKEEQLKFQCPVCDGLIIENFCEACGRKQDAESI